MAAPVALKATIAFTFRGRTLTPGERFEASPVEAAILAYRRHATFARERAPVSEARDVVPGAPKGRSKRRDIVPEE